MEKKGALDHATVLVERDPSLTPDDVEKFSADLKDRVRRKLKNDTAVSFEVDILPPNTRSERFPRPSGWTIEGQNIAPRRTDKARPRRLCA